MCELRQLWLFCLDFMSSFKHGWPWTTLAILFRLYVLPQAWVNLENFGYFDYTLCPPSGMGDLGRPWLFCLDFMSSLKHGWPWTTLFCLDFMSSLRHGWPWTTLFCLDFMSSLRHGWPWTTLAILLRLYVLPQAWLTLDDFVLFRLYVLPQAWVTLDDFGYSV